MEKNYKKRKTYIVGMIKRSTPRGSFESTSYDILVGIIKILVQVLLSANTMKKIWCYFNEKVNKAGGIFKNNKIWYIHQCWQKNNETWRHLGPRLDSCKDCSKMLKLQRNWLIRLVSKILQETKKCNEL